MGIWDQFYEKAKAFFDSEGDTSTQPKKRCYYDLLEVDKNATEDEIKKSFKKLALKWHPDKNPDRLEECTAYFVLIQQAYEVLVDPQERAFYDRHRENIIHGSGAENNEKKDTGIDVKLFMNPACFRSFGNNENQIEKFYSVYRELFHKIAAEEYAYIDDPDERDFPVFGKTDSDYGTIVHPFYAFWLDFSTNRSFAWLDKWDLSQAPDRSTARMMEKENKKLREFGKRQRNEDIRELVKFVRKHDKRVAQQKEYLQKKMEEQMRKAEEARISAIRKNLEDIEEFQVNEESKKEHMLHLEEIENMLDAEFGTESDGDIDEDEDAANQNYCIVCEKSFKSSKSLLNHQKSKKHKQTVEFLRKHMQDENKELFEDGDDAGKSEDDLMQEKQRISKKSKKRQKEARKTNDESELPEKEEPLVIKPESTHQSKECKNNEDLKSNKNKAHQKAQNKINTGGQTVPVASSCQICEQEFESRSKLFQHIKESGHAAPKTTTVPIKSSKKKASKK